MHYVHSSTHVRYFQFSLTDRVMTWTIIIQGSEILYQIQSSRHIGGQPPAIENKQSTRGTTARKTRYLIDFCRQVGGCCLLFFHFA